MQMNGFGKIMLNRKSLRGMPKHIIKFYLADLVSFGIYIISIDVIVDFLSLNLFFLLLVINLIFDLATSSSLVDPIISRANRYKNDHF